MKREEKTLLVLFEDFLDKCLNLNPEKRLALARKFIEGSIGQMIQVLKYYQNRVKTNNEKFKEMILDFQVMRMDVILSREGIFGLTPHLSHILLPKHFCSSTCSVVFLSKDCQGCAAPSVAAHSWS